MLAAYGNESGLTGMTPHLLLRPSLAPRLNGARLLSRNVVLALALTLSVTGHADALYSPLPDTFFREGWAAAKDHRGCIPQEFWAPALLELKPIKVCSDRINIAVTTAIEGDCELGRYYQSKYSSYLPRPVKSPDRTFTWDARERSLKFRFCTLQVIDPEP